MRTYQDLLAVGENEKRRAEFCRDAIGEFKNSTSYNEAKIGDAYYRKHNVTIENYQKMITTISGSHRPDVYSANYKLKTLFFRRLVLQQVGYVLGNGVTLSNEKNKQKLGKDFDFQLMSVAKRAMACGTAFGFWNLDHLEVFSYADNDSEAGFCPLYDKHSGKLMSGIRFWERVVDDNKILRCTLYEDDGYTEYKIDDDETIMLEPKRGYIRHIKQTMNEIEDVIDENYGCLPIVPLYANDTHESELVGIRESIDCYDFVKSGFANNIDDASEIYWLLKNTGGMDDLGLAQFLHRLKTVHGAVIDGDAGADVEAKTIDIPYEARGRLLEILRHDIYEDFQSLDVQTLSASAKTTQEIQAAYQAQDNKCADFEFYLIDFVQNILKIAGINDEPTFRWNRIINQTEQTTMVLQCANYLTDDVIIKHLPFLTPEEADSIIADRDKEDFDRFEGTGTVEEEQKEIIVIPQNEVTE